MTNRGADATPWPSPRYGWFVVFLLVLAYAFGVVDRIVIGLLTQPIKADLQLSDTELGLIVKNMLDAIEWPRRPGLPQLPSAGR